MAPSNGPDYFSKYENFALDRSSSGVLTLRFHTNGGPATFTGTMHSSLPRLLDEIGSDHDNAVLVLTGSGNTFMADIDGPSLGDITNPTGSFALYSEGKRIPQRFVDLELPIVAAVNGTASVHSEYALLADVVIADDTTVFSDLPHLAFGVVPGDGLQVVWEEVLGLNRARHLILTNGSFTAAEALNWGAVAEVVPHERVLPRAQEIAESFATRPNLLNRYVAATLRQRLSRRMAEGTALGLALECLTAANLPFVNPSS